MKRLLFIILILCLSADCFAAEPLTIGLSYSLTGKYQKISDQQAKAFRLWQSEVNKKGGILGRQIKLVMHDDKSDPKTARAIYEQLISRDRVDLLFAPYSSELTDAILPVTEKHGYPVIGTGAASDKLWQKGYRYFFGIYPLASRYTLNFIELLARSGFKTVAIVHADDIFSKSVADGTRHWAAKLELNVVHFSEIKNGEHNFNTVFTAARSANAEALLVCGHFEEAVDARLSLKKLGWRPRAFYATVGPALSSYSGRLGTDADYSFSSSQWEPHRKLPGSEAFYEMFRARHKEIPSYQAANAYAAGQLIERAAKLARTLDRKKLREILSSMDATTIIGRYGVDKSGRQTGRSLFIIQWQKGRKEIVWPEDVSTRKPVFDK